MTAQPEGEECSRDSAEDGREKTEAETTSGRPVLNARIL